MSYIVILMSFQNFSSINYAATSRFGVITENVLSSWDNGNDMLNNFKGFDSSGATVHSLSLYCGFDSIFLHRNGSNLATHAAIIAKFIR